MHTVTQKRFLGISTAGLMDLSINLLEYQAYSLFTSSSQATWTDLILRISKLLGLRHIIAISPSSSVAKGLQRIKPHSWLTKL